MIALSVKDICSIENLIVDLQKLNHSIAWMYEDDINERTAIAFVESSSTKQITNKLKLAGSITGTKNKHHD